MKAVIYARFSSHNQREESIEGQVRACQRFAKEHYMTVIEIYADRGLSGLHADNRPEFQRMIADSDRHKFQALIMWNLDRFSRDKYDTAVYKSRLKRMALRSIIPIRTFQTRRKESFSNRCLRASRSIIPPTFPATQSAAYRKMRGNASGTAAACLLAIPSTKQSTLSLIRLAPPVSG